MTCTINKFFEGIRFFEINENHNLLFSIRFDLEREDAKKGLSTQEVREFFEFFENAIIERVCYDEAAFNNSDDIEVTLKVKATIKLTDDMKIFPKFIVSFKADLKLYHVVVREAGK